MPASLLDRSVWIPRGWIDRVDPRARIVMAVLFSVSVAAATRLETLGLALIAAGSVAAIGGLGFRAGLRRLAPLNGFMLLVLILVPLTAGGRPMAEFGPVTISAEGVRTALAIALKGNAIVLAIVVLMGSLDLIALGHALHHLHVPEKLVHLLLFSVRYVGVLEREYRRLVAAMKVRGFRPRMNRHTYRTYGYLVGMLLVRSLERAERILAAMKCRGFRGHFYLLDHFALSRRDAWFAACGLSILAFLMLVEWS